MILFFMLTYIFINVYIDVYIESLIIVHIINKILKKNILKSIHFGYSPSLQSVSVYQINCSDCNSIYLYWGNEPKFNKTTTKYKKQFKQYKTMLEEHINDHTTFLRKIQKTHL